MTPGTHRDNDGEDLAEAPFSRPLIPGGARWIAPALAALIAATGAGLMTMNFSEHTSLSTLVQGINAREQAANAEINAKLVALQAMVEREERQITINSGRIEALERQAAINITRIDALDEYVHPRRGGRQ